MIDIAKQKRRLLSDIEDQILDLIQNHEEITTSDLQGIVQALVRQAAEIGSLYCKVLLVFGNK